MSQAHTVVYLIYVAALYVCARAEIEVPQVAQSAVTPAEVGNIYLVPGMLDGRTTNRPGVLKRNGDDQQMVLLFRDTQPGPPSTRHITPSGMRGQGSVATAMICRHTTTPPPHLPPLPLVCDQSERRLLKRRHERSVPLDIRPLLSPSRLPRRLRQPPQIWVRRANALERAVTNHGVRNKKATYAYGKSRRYGLLAVLPANSFWEIRPEGTGVSQVDLQQSRKSGGEVAQSSNDAKRGRRGGEHSWRQFVYLAAKVRQAGVPGVAHFS